MWCSEETVTFLKWTHETNINAIFPLFSTLFFTIWGSTGALLITLSCCAFFFCNSLMALTGELAPTTAHLDEPAPNIHITVVDGNRHSFAFPFADFLEIHLKMCSTFWWAPSYRHGYEWIQQLSLHLVQWKWYGPSPASHMPTLPHAFDGAHSQNRGNLCWAINMHFFFFYQQPQQPQLDVFQKDIVWLCNWDSCQVSPR